ncbi:hypothetical protein PAXRUDRAFT_170859 [Paxillus rubicundulus Ve08.2h10]|uniref:Uncharacterized protein n=1 Tax=Paxillus rubicundulus Ve08.2h10 TaxID=930991 RepID=A0A0D0D7A4_9AGAM|nr:hypothetical protein PAXRUDRAFT_170859 [Paxillus rubicundulus Ve08.2h10]
MVTWKELNEAQKRRNKDCRAAYHEELCLWEEERDLVKEEKRKKGCTKPKLGKLEASAPKPVVGNGDSDSAEDDNNGNNGNEDVNIDSDGRNGEE